MTFYTHMHAGARAHTPHTHHTHTPHTHHTHTTHTPHTTPHTTHHITPYHAYQTHHKHHKHHSYSTLNLCFSHILFTFLIFALRFLWNLLNFIHFLFSEEAGGVKSKISRALTADNQRALDECLRNSRYFIIKSNNYENVALSKAKVSLFCS